MSKPVISGARPLHPNAASTRAAGGRRLWAWAALCTVVGMGALLYLSISLSVSADPLLMPLDDTYIHFQYARQMAAGQPFAYHPGAPATSGGTSLLYPAVLALGYRLGFTGWSLAYWALALGALAFAGAAWLVYRIGANNPLVGEAAADGGIAFALALAFALTGPFLWAALSGMETALFLLLVLLAFYTVQQGRFAAAIAALALLPLIRPEGLFLAALGSFALAVRFPWPRTNGERVRRLALLAVPVLAGAIQPVINLAATGSVSSSGMTAKSHLANGSVPLVERVFSVLETFGRMWLELLTGISRDWGLFTSPVLPGVALGGMLVGVWLAIRQQRVTLPALALAWILALTAGVATLDTAFWQFKRYQVPVMGLFFPVAAWTCAALADRLAERGLPGWSGWILPLLILLPAAWTTLTFARNYAENVRVVRDQQVPMARWAAQNLPEGARVGVHDVGLMGYFSGHALYDVVGLTTPGPSESWRQGPGAIFEHMAQSEFRPDHFAIYPDVQGLRYLVDAGVFGEVLAEFAIDLPPHNVAAATGRQIVSRADWSGVLAAESPAQAETLRVIDGLALVDAVDVADLESEAAHDYEWWQDELPAGFATEVYRLAYQACDEDAACEATDGGRVLTGGEAFTLATRPGEDLLLVTRVHGRESVPLTVEVNGERQTSRVQPAVPGRWVEFVTWVPGDRVTAETRVRITVEGAGAYQPYYHWAYQGAFSPDESDQASVARFGTQGQVRLLAAEIAQQPTEVEVRLTWLGPAPDAGDAVLFVHLYNQSDAPPVAQAADARPGGGALPPGNWLPGVRTDTITLALPDLPPGEYPLAIGLYDAGSGARLPVEGDGADEDGRLFIGHVLIEE